MLFLSSVIAILIQDGLFVCASDDPGFGATNSFAVLHRNYSDVITAMKNLHPHQPELEDRDWLENGPLKHERSMAFLYQSGMTLEDLDDMGMIHVAGTKGKGSTCALTESILRQRGLKTGLFTSPHMVSFRERIRINGEPLNKEKFAKYFWKVYNLIVTPNDPYDRPSYFQLLTVLALNIFWHEGIDVAVMEVGVGGRFDATNIIRNPIVCGITTLDIDHTGSLGNTIEEIALHKAGIMKRGRLTIVDGYQRKDALKVLEREARKVGSPIFSIPPPRDYEWGTFSSYSTDTTNEMQSSVYERNVAMALQLSRFYYDYYLSQRLPTLDAANEPGIPQASGFRLELEEVMGIKLCKWPGRAQVVTRMPHNNADQETLYFLDGAHTAISIDSCSKWFAQASDFMDRSAKDSHTLKVLLFSVSGARDARTFMTMLAEAVKFDIVIFSPKLITQSDLDENIRWLVPGGTEQYEAVQELATIWNELNDYPEAIPVRTVNEGVEIVNKASTNYNQTHVLVTGSLHLLGSLFQVLEEDLVFKAGSDEEESLRKNLEQALRLAGMNKSDQVIDNLEDMTCSANFSAANKLCKNKIANFMPPIY